MLFFILEKLLKLLSDRNEEDKIMKAEIFRELGDFDSCILLLKKRFKNEELNYLAEFIEYLASKKITQVKIIN